MRPLPRGLNARMTLLVCAILAATVASYGWVTSSQQGARIEAALRAQAATLVRTIADTSTHHLVVGDYAALEGLLLEVSELANVLAVQVVEPDGTGLVNISHQPGRGPTKVGGPFRVEPPRDGRAQTREEGSQIVLWQPIAAGPTIGWVRMTSDLAEVGATRTAIWRSSLALGLLWVLGGSALLLTLLRPTVEAIQRTAAFARTLGERTGDQLALVDGPSEIVALGAALNGASLELLARERELLAERERLEVTLRSLGEAVLVADTAGATILMNGVAEQLAGWPSSEALGEPIAEVCRLADGHGALLAEHPAALALRRCAAAATPEQTLLLPRAGPPREVVANSAPVLDAQGRRLGTVTVVRDVTERSNLERQLRQAQKMEAVGQLAGGIAHDFNNILTAIIGYGTLLQMRIDAGDPARENLTQILDAAERAANLTQSLLAFSRKQVMALRGEDLGAIVRGIEKILRRLTREDVVLRIELAAAALPVVVDRGQIEQVLLNLITNARDAMPHGGEIRIATAAAGDVPGWAALTVSDTGIGMTADVRERIFDPFFTTKEPGKGTGLGLAMVYGIVTQHHGKITVESEPGAGTTFRILLPFAEGAAATVATPEARELRGGGETILVVEDDGAVRTITRRLLEAAGYVVLAAADGEEGFRVFSQDPGRVDLVLSDLVMPRAGGSELLERLRALRPGLRALFVTGYTAEGAGRDYVRESGAPVLTKPIRREALLRAVREVLDASLPAPRG